MVNRDDKVESQRPKDVSNDMTKQNNCERDEYLGVWSAKKSGGVVDVCSGCDTRRGRGGRTHLNRRVDGLYSKICMGLAVRGE